MSASVMGCSDKVIATDDDETSATDGDTSAEDSGTDDSGADDSSTDTDVDTGEGVDTGETTDWDTSDATTIVYTADGVIVTGPGATADGDIATVTSAGTFYVSGSSSDGQLLVATADADTVYLVLEDLSLTNTSSAPVWIQQAEDVEIFLSEGTTTTLEDASSYTLPDGSDEPNAALFSAEDLTIRGPGSLIVTAHYNDGIASKDTLQIENGSITVSAPDDGLRGKDAVELQGGVVTLDVGGDGVSSDNEEDADQGRIELSGGILDITAGDEGFAAVSDISITSGTLTIDAGGDGLHSDGTFTLTNGALQVAAGDDGLHAEGAMSLDGGQVIVSDSYEGIESPTLTINGGVIYVTTSDDGLNAGGSTSSLLLTINDGYLAVYAGGDGIDSNGNIVINGGVILVHGPTENMNGPMDYGDRGASFTVNGGFLVASGSSGMAVAPGTASTQRAVLVNLTSSQRANTIFHLENAAGDDVLTFAPSKTYQSVLFSGPSLETGEHTVFLGGSHTGEVLDGLYGEGTYTPGTEYTSFTISSTITQVGSSGGGPRGG